MNHNLKAKEILTFVPSGPNYDLAIRFYQEIGFRVDWKSETEAILNKDGCRFFLQNLAHNWGKREVHLVDPCNVLWHISVRSK